MEDYLQQVEANMVLKVVCLSMSIPSGVKGSIKDYLDG